MDTLGIIRQIEHDEALRAQLRAVLLGDEMLELPNTARRLEARLGQLTEAQVRTEASLAQLAEATGRWQQDATDWQQHAEGQFADLKGSTLELRIGANPRHYVPRRLATGVRLVSAERFDQLMNALSEDDATDLERSDALIEARLRNGNDVVLVVEASWTAHIDDIERAERRAHILRRAGVEARPLVVSHVDPAKVVLAAAARRGVAVVGQSSGLLTPLGSTAA